MQKERVLKGLLKRRVSITKALLVTFLITGGLSLAGTIGEAQNEIDTNNKLTAGTYTGESSGSIILTKTDTSFEGDVKFNVVSTGEETRLDLNGQNVKVNSLVVRINPKEGAHSRPKGIWLRGNSKATIENLNVDIALRSKITGSKYSADSNASYGVALGINETVHGAGDGSGETHLTVNNMNISVKNTEDTILNVYTVSKRVSFGPFSFNVNASVDFTHQLSGLRLVRLQGDKTTFISNGETNIKVEDVSATKSGDYLAGIFISGNEASATFNGHSNIKIIGEGVNSAAIKIGKPGESFEKNMAPKVIFNGKMNIDTTKAKNSPAIRLFTNNVSLEVTGKNNEEASVINSGNTAIAFDVQDYRLFL
ncbi:hypothetical protein [Streptobacillus canis]|uniref:hypothetical protein n=1 Tax=Streptobacillus canis TaxID=2678686 RepID=UPI0012E2C37D|nr:hypothetical protein [Streptobacillus canis]